MLTFQTDIDEVTGEQVLTCFLLPQLEYQNEQQGTSHPASLSLCWGFLSTLLISLLSFSISRALFTHLVSFVTFLWAVLFYFSLSIIYFFCVCVSYPFDVVVTEGAPALLRRWGGNGPIGWRANVSPWFHTPLFGSSFSIDDGFGTVGTKFLFFLRICTSKSFALPTNP